MKIYNVIIIFVSWVMLAACTKGDPKIETGTNASLTLDSSVQKINSPSQIVTVSGDCDKRMNTIEVSLNGGVSWVNVTTVAATSNISCVNNKRFIFTIDPTAASVSAYLGFTTNQVETKKLKVRGKTIIGGGQASEFLVTYEPAAQTPSGSYILSGNSVRLLSSANYKMQGRIGVQTLAQPGTDRSVSSNYVLKSGMQRNQ